MKTFHLVIAFTLATVALVAAETDALKAYYEQQKAEIAPTFVAPALGSGVKIELASGQPRIGILMKIGDGEITVMSESGDTVVYKRQAMKGSTRAQFFAEDYAHLKALEKTREYKEQLFSENMAEEAANTHEGSLSVSAKVEKSSDKTVDKEEKEVKKSGEMREYVTTTKSSIEIQKLNITVSNPTTHPDTYTLEYLFFSEPVAKGQPARKPKKGEEAPAEENVGIKLKDKSAKKITVPARGRQSITLASEPFKVDKVQVAVDGRTGNNAPRESGEESAGYIVILKHGTRVLDMKASAKSYLKEEWLRKFR